MVDVATSPRKDDFLEPPTKKRNVELIVDWPEPEQKSGDMPQADDGQRTNEQADRKLTSDRPISAVACNSSASEEALKFKGTSTAKVIMECSKGASTAKVIMECSGKKLVNGDIKKDNNQVEPKDNKEESPFPEIACLSSVTKKEFEDMEGTESVTMVDIQEEEEELEEHATAVLGACDENNCTYSKGYVKRQALYACVTCSREQKNQHPGGICLACSYHCHEGHELIELYTKRQFRCDCGNSKFLQNKCTLEPNKDVVNMQNKYNHNFRGLYCVCKRPYPDPENDLDDNMIQCIVCEDWYHEGHLDTPIPSEGTHEVICASCMKELKYLAHYIKPDIIKMESQECSLKGKENPDDVGTAVFPDGWRGKLCRCKSCRERYDSQGVAFLLDNEDTLTAYEEHGRSKLETYQEREIRALSTMGRIQQMECIQEYNNMSSELKEYLKKFAENGKVVCAEDIREFFSGIKARKRQRLNVHIPYFCH